MNPSLARLCPPQPLPHPQGLIYQLVPNVPQAGASSTLRVCLLGHVQCQVLGSVNLESFRLHFLHSAEHHFLPPQPLSKPLALWSGSSQIHFELFSYPVFSNPPCLDTRLLKTPFSLLHTRRVYSLLVPSLTLPGFHGPLRLSRLCQSSDSLYPSFVLCP